MQIMASMFCSTTQHIMDEQPYAQALSHAFAKHYRRHKHTHLHTMHIHTDARVAATSQSEGLHPTPRGHQSYDPSNIFAEL